jgi:methyl-accepting chemotaxis protein
MTTASAALRQRLPATAPHALLRLPEFWQTQRAFLAVVAVAVLSFFVLRSYTYASSGGWQLMSAVVQSLAVWGAIITARGLAVLAVEEALVVEIERRGSEYLRDIKSGQRSRIDLDVLEQTMVPNNPSTPPPAMIRLFQHICKEAKDRKFESSVNIMQPYREEPLDDIFKLQNLQKIALWLGILGTFIGLLLAIGSADLSGGDFMEVVRKMFNGLAVSFSASLAGLQVAVILGMFLLVLRNEQERYFKQMESAVVTMLSLARNAINKDDFFVEFSQVRDTVDALTDTVHSQTQEIKRQTEEIAGGLHRLAEARSNLDRFIQQMAEAQSDFIGEVKAIYDTISLNSLTDRLKENLDRASRLMGDKMEIGTTLIANRLVDFNRSIEGLSKALEAQARSFNTSTLESAGAMKAVVTKIQELSARDAGATHSVRSEMLELSNRIGALARSIEKIERVAPRQRTIREVLTSLRW